MGKLQMIAAHYFILLTVLCVGCNADCADYHCTAFFDVSCDPDLDCCLMGVSKVTVDEEAKMTVKAGESDLTYQWWKEEGDIIDHNSTKFFLEDDNRTLSWQNSEDGSTIFYVNVTDVHGITEKACFMVQTFCPLCDHESQCPKVPDAANSTANVTEHLDFTDKISIIAQVEFSILKWCFIGADNQTTCCICDNNYSDIRGAGNCSHKDWELTSNYGKGCSYEYGCSIRIRNVTREKYNGGVLQSKSFIVGLPQFTRIIKNISIHVKSCDKNANNNNKLIYQVIGCGVFVSLIAVAAVACMVYALKKRNYKIISWPLGHHGGYEEIPSLVAAGDDVISRDFSINGYQNDDRSCSLSVDECGSLENMEASLSDHSDDSELV